MASWVGKRDKTVTASVVAAGKEDGRVGAAVHADGAFEVATSFLDTSNDWRGEFLGELDHVFDGDTGGFRNTEVFDQMRVATGLA